jgi:hypothetical protein
MITANGDEDEIRSTNSAVCHGENSCSARVE